MDPVATAQALQGLATEDTAWKRRDHIRPLRGIRGVPEGELSRFIARTWEEARPSLDRDAEALETLYSGAWEDGIVAIGLAASCLVEDPAGVLDLGLFWLDHVDDVMTADALGWLMLGPGSLATGRFDEVLATTVNAHHPAAKRAGVIMGMALLPTPIQGPGAAALRAALGTEDGQIVEEPRTRELRALADAFARNEDPGVRKGLRRVLGTWTLHDTAATERWMREFPGGIHKMLREEIETTAAKVTKRAARRTGS
jgi:hypothetical protein